MKRKAIVVAIVTGGVVALWSVDGQPESRSADQVAVSRGEVSEHVHARHAPPTRSDPRAGGGGAASVVGPEEMRTFERDPVLERKAERARTLSESAVLSAGGLAELRRLYADEALIGRQRERLLRSDPATDRSPPKPGRTGSYTFAQVNGSLPAEGEVERMDAVRFLSEALRWKDNPARDEVAASIERVLLDDSVTEALHPGVRRGMMGDKIELYSIYVREFPSASNTLVARAESPRVEKLLSMARGFHEAGYGYDTLGKPRLDDQERAR